MAVIAVMIVMVAAVASQTHAQIPTQTQTQTQNDRPFPRPTHAPVPGGVAVVKLGGADSPVAEVRFNGKRVLTLRQPDGFYAVVGLALDTAPGMHPLQVLAAGESTQLAFSTSFEVKPKAYPAQHLKINQRLPRALKSRSGTHRAGNAGDYQGCDPLERHRARRPLT